jgi:hypothetical protein
MNNTEVLNYIAKQLAFIPLDRLTEAESNIGWCLESKGFLQVGAMCDEDYTWHEFKFGEKFVNPVSIDI